METMRTLHAAVLAACAALALAGCDREATQRAQQGVNETGRKIDSALERTQQKLAEAGREVKPELERAGEKISAAARNAGDEIKRADDKIRESAQARMAQADAKREAEAASNGSSQASPPAAAPAPAAAGTTTTTVTTGERTSVQGISPETRARLGDAAITASIKADYLKDPDLSVLKIDVDTKGGVVTLNGLAKDEAARKRAEQLAGAIKGVTEVRNFLTVKRG